MVDKQYSSKMKWREIKITIWMRKESKEEINGKGLYNEQRQILNYNKQ